MMQRITAFFLVIGGIFVIYRNRYRMMNKLFGNRMIRRMFVSMIMSLPFVRQRMMRTMFEGIN